MQATLTTIVRIESDGETFERVESEAIDITRIVGKSKRVSFEYRRVRTGEGQVAKNLTKIEPKHE